MTMTVKQFLGLKITNLLLIFVVSCNSTNYESNLKEGKYTCIPSNTSEKIFNKLLKGKSYILSNELIILKSNQFTYNDCTNLSFGSYEIIKDSLHLHIDSTLIRGDSMNYTKFTESYYINEYDDYLILENQITNANTKEKLNVI